MLLKTMFLLANLDLKWTIISTANAVSMTYCGSNTSVNMNNNIVINPVNTYQAGRPSRYKTMMNILYIKALPGSGCGNISKTGKSIIASA